MYHIGINYYGHDTSCCLFKNDKLIFAIEEERLTRKKHDGSLPLKSLEYIKNKFKLNDKNVKTLNFATIPERLVSEKYIKIFLNHEKDLIKMFFSKKNVKNIDYLLKIRQLIKNKIPFKKDLNFYHHHLCHQYSAYYLSGFKSAACLSIDGLGEIESTCLGHAKNNKIEIFKSINFPHSLGEVYSAITQYLGYKPDSGEGTVMALAALGNRKAKVKKTNQTYEKIFQKIIKIKNDNFIIDLDWFDYWRKRSNVRVSSKFLNIFGPQRRTNQSLNDNYKNIAAALQNRFQDAYIKIIKQLLEKTKEKNLVLSGGCALNCKANGFIEKSFNLKDIYIQPAAGDNGLAVGAAYLGYLKHTKFKKFRPRNVDHSYYGPSFNNQSIKNILIHNQKKIYFKFYKNIEKKTASLLQKNKIIGWFQGNMEFGPRALGNRSILATPSDLNVKKRLNLKIKNRDYFRPFAPAVLESEAKKIFNLKFKSPFMLIATTVRNEQKIRKKIPGILHYDSSARIQTVEKKINKKFYNLINEFYKKTGIPMLLNTSFNGKGEPIVCNPQDAINSYLKNKMDYVVIGNYLIEKKIS